MQSMTTPDRTLDQILDFAAAHFKVPRQKLTPDDDFFKTLKIDSLQALDLLTRLEHHFISSCRIMSCRGCPTSERWPAAFNRGCETRIDGYASRCPDANRDFFRILGQAMN